MSNDIHSAADVIKNAKSFGLIGHQNPDADALGSALAMAGLLRDQGKQVWVSWPDPYDVSRDAYEFLPGIAESSPSSQVDVPDVVMAFDCASIKRLCELGEKFSAASNSIVIDHHVSNEGFGKTNVIVPTAASTTTVVRELARVLDWPLTKEVAVCLYAGLIADTGRFQYSNTNADVFALANELVQFDIPVADISRKLFDENRFAALQLTAEIIKRAELDDDLKLVWSSIDSSDLEKYGVQRVELEGVIDVLRRTAEAEVSCFLREYDGEVHGSLRAVSNVDVSAIAKSFGGGGHRLAAGFSTTGTIAETIAAIKSQLVHQ